MLLAFSSIDNAFLWQELFFRNTFPLIELIYSSTEEASCLKATAKQNYIQKIGLIIPASLKPGDRRN